MEALHGERKQITELTGQNGTLLQSKDEVLNHVHGFYNQLWGTKKNINLENQEQYLNQAIIEEETENHGNSTISMQELESSTMLQNKKGSPGIDGLTARLYIWAWDIIKEDLHEVTNNCYLAKEMSKSMRTVIVTLIPKKGDT